MTYNDIALLQADDEFTRRVAACYATETWDRPVEPGVVPPTPHAWAEQHSWVMAAQPGFGDAYGYALETGNEHPGSDPAVITDAQILSAVQPMVPPAPAAPTVEPEPVELAGPVEEQLPLVEPEETAAEPLPGDEEPAVPEGDPLVLADPASAPAGSEPESEPS